MSSTTRLESNTVPASGRPRVTLGRPASTEVPTGDWTQSKWCPGGNPGRLHRRVLDLADVEERGRHADVARSLVGSRALDNGRASQLEASSREVFAGTHNPAQRTTDVA